MEKERGGGGGKGVRQGKHGILVVYMVRSEMRVGRKGYLAGLREGK